jgi:hypothetical protein
VFWPTPDGAVDLDGEARIVTGPDVDRVDHDLHRALHRAARRSVANLAVLVPSPGEDGARRREREHVLATALDLLHVRERRDKFRRQVIRGGTVGQLAVGVVAPRRDPTGTSDRGGGRGAERKHDGDERRDDQTRRTMTGHPGDLRDMQGRRRP